MYTVRIRPGDSVFIAGLRLRVKWLAGSPVLCIGNTRDNTETEVEADREVVRNGAKLLITRLEDARAERTQARLLIGAPRELKITKEMAA